jgi:hypothetical protein
MQRNDNSVSGYSELAAKRYRQYMLEKQKESLFHQLMNIILHILKILVGTFEKLGLKKTRKIEKVNVEL